MKIIEKCLKIVSVQPSFAKIVALLFYQDLFANFPLKGSNENDKLGFIVSGGVR